MRRNNLVAILAALGTAILAGCGGGGGGGGGATQTSVISGVASKGPINGGTVQVFAIDGAGVRASAPLNSAIIKTGLDGSYSVDVGSYTGAVLVEVRGGSYVDEADPTVTKDLQTEVSGGMRAVVANVSTGVSTVAITPLWRAPNVPSCCSANWAITRRKSRIDP